jgi:hypothetical protein
MDRKKDLVMGAIKGYTFEQLRPFILSLQQTNFRGDICFLYYQLSEETKNQLRNHGVLLHPLVYRGNGALNSWGRFWPFIRPFASILKRFEGIRVIMKYITPMQTSRFFGYTDFLIKHQDEYRNVLLADVRDVMFQADPFGHFNKAKVQCYEEDLTYEEDKFFNQGWVDTLFGEQVGKRFVKRKIVCVGTILGPVQAMIEFLKKFELIVLGSNNVEIIGTDQGSHNYLVREIDPESVDVVANGEGEVLTYYAPCSDTYHVDNKGMYCDKKGNIIPVVHQYDRNKELEQLVIKRLSQR